MSDIKSTASTHDQIIALLPALKAFARRFERTENDAEDLVQETVSKALGHLGQFQEGTSLKSWLFTIMRNTYCTSYKRRKREPVGAVDDLTVLQVPVKSSQDWLVHAQDVRSAVDRLYGPYREALMLVVAGSSYEEAAVACSCEVGTIKSRVNRARTHLMQMLGEVHASDAASLH